MQLDDIYRRELLEYLQRLGSALIDQNEHQNSVALAQQVVLAALDQRRVELAPEVIGGGRPGSLGMILVRKRQRLAYSIKLSNFMRDPIVSASASALGMFAISYVPTVAAAPPATFPGFLIGVGFAVFRAFAHPIGYGDPVMAMALIAGHDKRRPRADRAEAADNQPVCPSFRTKKSGAVIETMSMIVPGIVAVTSDYDVGIVHLLHEQFAPKRAFEEIVHLETLHEARLFETSAVERAACCRSRSCSSHAWRGS